MSIDIDHIKSGHTTGGDRAKQSRRKDVFPDGVSDEYIERAVRQAYKNGEKIGSNSSIDGVESVKLRGAYDGQDYEMWVNVRTKNIETAYPVNGRR